MEIKANNADILRQVNVIIRLCSSSNKADPFPGANKKFEPLLLNQNVVQEPNRIHSDTVQREKDLILTFRPWSDDQKASINKADISKAHWEGVVIDPMTSGTELYDFIVFARKPSGVRYAKSEKRGRAGKALDQLDYAY